MQDAKIRIAAAETSTHRHQRREAADFAGAVIREAAISGVSRRILPLRGGAFVSKADRGGSARLRKIRTMRRPIFAFS